MDIPGFYFCLCPDSTLAREHVDGLLKRVNAVGREREIRTFWADEGLDGRFWEALTMQGLTERPRALLVRGAQTLTAEVWKKLSAVLATPRPDILPVFFLESLWEKGQPKLPAHIAKLRCLEFADKQGWVWRSAGLDARALRKHVQQRAAALELRLTPDALDALCAVVTPDAAAVRGVLEQLALASGDGEVGVELVRNMAESAPEVIIFEFIRHLQSGNSAAVWRTLLREGDGGESLLFPLLALLTREARLLWQIQAGENVWLPQQTANLKRSLASRLGTSGLANLFAALMEAEWAVKSGRRQPLQALEELVGSLTLAFTPA
ncbi:MAG TPA: DNA polymerase III subunit delta [Candidatus Mailhella merdigallinarum]|uniref:DNA-directed DNA polymerase n=1 Tax=Candidatus Mailhella merdigallinarum TaxID=2838658 RepID=A0A9D2HFF8_9BACT|nr:DNA polymerase III subunit delta [Candidatus Mailhella merdigallinarum]